jgi:hypothetical protein
MEAPFTGKKEGGEQDFILGHFYIILNLEVGRKFMPIPVSNGLRITGRIWEDSCITPVLILRHPKSMREEISSVI